MEDEFLEMLIATVCHGKGRRPRQILSSRLKSHAAVHEGTAGVVDEAAKDGLVIVLQPLSAFGQVGGALQEGESVTVLVAPSRIQGDGMDGSAAEGCGQSGHDHFDVRGVGSVVVAYRRKMGEVKQAM